MSRDFLTGKTQKKGVKHSAHIKLSTESPTEKLRGEMSSLRELPASNTTPWQERNKA